MPADNRSISFQVISTIVTVATIILVIYAVLTMILYRDREMSKLQSRVEVAGGQLQTALGPALWEYNVIQLNKVLDGAMADGLFEGIIIKAGKNVYFRNRNDALQVTAMKPAAVKEGLILHEEPIIYLGENVGSLKLMATTKLINDEILVSLYIFGGSILLLDFFLVISLYWIFRKIVLDPLKKLESYAISASSGDMQVASFGNLSFRGELEVLRASLENMLNQLESRYSELKLEARRLADSEKLFRILVNTIPDLIWLKDADGVYLSCNKMFERFFGAVEADIVGKTDYDFVDRDQADFFREHDRIAMSAGKPCSNEECISFAEDGHQAVFDTTKAPMYDVDGKLIGVLGVARDITERKMAEEEKSVLQDQLLQAQKMESVGRLAGGVAHDFNNMLGVILGHADMAINTVDPNDPIHDDLSSIISAANRSAALTRQLLAFARKQAVVPKMIDLNATVAGMIKMLRRLIGEDIDFKWLPGKEVWPVKIDPSQLDQILANLCVNSRDAVDGAGRISIVTKNETFKDFQCPWLSESISGDFTVLSVSDSGCGIEPQIFPHIFEPFYTSKETGKGTGLGLATVFGAVRQNNGFIIVESLVSKGTTVHICLPRQEGDDTQAIDESSSEDRLLGSETILVVEDEKAILKILRLMLEGQGYRVLAASSPREAFDIVKKNEFEIHLLLTDVIMPEMNGRDMADRLISLYPKLKILFMSGYTADHISKHGVLNEGVHFIQKPFSNGELNARIRDIMSVGQNS